MIRIKNATIKNKEAILNLLYELGRPKPSNKKQLTSFEKKIQNYISDNDKQILLAFDDSKIIGITCIVFLSRLNHTTTEMWIPELIVSGQYRNKGIGQKIINHCIKIAKKKKCFRIRLESAKNRKITHKFYKKVGFESYAFSFRKTLS